MSERYVLMHTHPNEGECTCRQKHLPPSVSCLFYLRGSASCLTVTLCITQVFMRREETAAAMEKQVRSDKETFSVIVCREFH